MKTKVLRLIPVVLMMTILFTIGSIVSAEEDDSCGELQLEFSNEENKGGVIDPPEVGVMSIYLVKSCGPFFHLHGFFDPWPVMGDPDDLPVLISGSCQVCDDCIEGESTPILYCNATSTQWHAQKPYPPGPEQPQYQYNWFDHRAIQIIFNLTTGEGHSWNVGIDFRRYEDLSGNFQPVPDSFFSAQYGKGTISLVGELPGCLKRYKK